MIRGNTQMRILTAVTVMKRKKQGNRKLWKKRGVFRKAPKAGTFEL